MVDTCQMQVEVLSRIKPTAVVSTPTPTTSVASDARDTSRPTVPKLALGNQNILDPDDELLAELKLSVGLK